MIFFLIILGSLRQWTAACKNRRRGGVGRPCPGRMAGLKTDGVFIAAGFLSGAAEDRGEEAGPKQARPASAHLTAADLLLYYRENVAALGTPASVRWLRIRHGVVCWKPILDINTALPAAVGRPVRRRWAGQSDSLLSVCSVGTRSRQIAGVLTARLTASRFASRFPMN